jgi:hypothetical protein
VDRDGISHPAVDVGGKADDPESFLRKRGSVQPWAKLQGWVAFDAAGGYVPARLTLTDDDQVLLILFKGESRAA